MPELKHPEVEKPIEESKEEIEEINVPQELLDNPYIYICNFYESIYLHMGRKCFSIMALMPPSLIMPKIKGRKKFIKQKINFFLIAPPGTAKTSIAEEFEKITYTPLFVENITSARLHREIDTRNEMSLITSDVATSLEDEELVKFLEGAIGDEGTTSRATMHNRKEELRKKKEVIAFLSGTHENISNHKIKDGFLMRCSPLVIIHSNKQHEEILDFVNDSIGENSEETDCEHISDFYQLLYNIQKGKHPDIDPIKDFYFPKQIKEEIKDFIKPLVKPGFKEFGITAVRQVQEAYRFMASHAFLNIHKKYENGLLKDSILTIDESDLKIAKFLIEREIDNIFVIVDSISELNKQGIRTYKQLREWTERKKMEEKKEIKREKMFIMRGLVK